MASHAMLQARAPAVGLRRASPLAAPTPSARPSPRLRLPVLAMAKGMGKKRLNQQMQSNPAPPVPPVDPDNAEFVLFVRAKKFPQWYPLSIVKGGTAANMMVKALEGGNVGNKLYKDTLVRNIGAIIYRDRKKVEAELKRMPALKAFSEFEYAFKIRDKANPKNWYIPDATVIVIPPEDQLPTTPIDTAKNALEGVGEAVQDMFKGIGNIKIG